MWSLLRRWPLLAVTIALLSTYVALAKMSDRDETEGPRTFVAGLAAVVLGAWLYSVAADHDAHNDNE